MYEIRFYYKNEDRHCKKNVVYHPYASYTTYQEACSELQWLSEFYFNKVTFANSFPESKIESYTLLLSERGKSFATIVMV